MKKDMTCTRCGFNGNMKTYTPGWFIVELALWCCLFLPGLIYSSWRIQGRKIKCPECGSVEIVPGNSPVGKKLYANFNRG